MLREPSRPEADGTLVPTRTPWLLRGHRAPAGWYSSLIGWGARRQIPKPLRKPVYGAFARMVGATPDEADRDLEEYPTFGEFFARKLRPGLRPFEDATAFSSPCDGALAASGPIEDGTLVQAKGRWYRIDELLADGDAAKTYAGGWYATIYLSPADYHRVHAPIAGKVTGYDYVPGALWPVKPWFTRNVDSLLARNERAIVHLDTAVGPVAVVLVGAIGVGNLFLTHAEIDSREWRARGEHHHLDLPSPVQVARGDELGAFLLGSTVVVVVPAGAVDHVAVEGAVRCGQPLGRLR